MIEKAIHEILNDAAIPNAVALLALLPASRIVTGTQHGQDLPYACINLESDGPEYYANTGKMRRARLRINLWHENHTAGATIREAFQKLFDNESFDTTETVITRCRHDNSMALEEDDGVWQFIIDLEIWYAQKET